MKVVLCCLNPIDRVHPCKANAGDITSRPIENACDPLFFFEVHAKDLLRRLLGMHPGIIASRNFGTARKVTARKVKHSAEG